MNLERHPPSKEEIFVDHITHVVEDLDAANADLVKYGFKTSKTVDNLQKEGSLSIEIILDQGFIKITKSPDYLFSHKDTPSISSLALETNNLEGTQGRLTLSGFHPLPLAEEIFWKTNSSGDFIKADASVCKLRKSDMAEAYAEYIFHDPENSLWQGSNPSHDNSIQALRDIVVGVNDPDEATGRYSWFANKGSLKKIGDLGWRITLDRGNLVICQSSALDTLMNAQILKKTTGIIAYSVLSKSLEATVEFFKNKQLNIKKIHESLIVLYLPESVGGCVFIGEKESAFPWNN